MAKRKRRKTSKHQSAVSYIVILVGMLVVCIFLAQRVASLSAKSKELSKEEAALEQRIEEAKLEHDKLVAQEQYMLTNEYIEDVAKEKLGLVFPYEIIIRPNE